MGNEAVHRRIGSLREKILQKEMKLNKLDKPWKFWNVGRVSKLKNEIKVHKSIMERLWKIVDYCDNQALDKYFGSSRASWLTVPRGFMNAMPKEWQHNMARLLHEYEESFDWDGIERYDTHVSLKQNGKFVKMPDFLANYRRTKVPKEIYHGYPAKRESED